MLVELGLTSAKEGYKPDGSDETAYRPMDGLRVLTIGPVDKPMPQVFTEITHAMGLYGYHSDDPPAWVWSDSPGMQALLAEHYGCAAGKPADLEETHYTENGPPGVGPAEGA